jgi:hypothetical protein
MSPGRKVGSRFTSNEASPNAFLPLQVQFVTSCLRYKKAVSRAVREVAHRRDIAEVLAEKHNRGDME